MKCDELLVILLTLSSPLFPHSISRISPLTEVHTQVIPKLETNNGGALLRALSLHLNPQNWPMTFKLAGMKYPVEPPDHEVTDGEMKEG